MLTSSAEPASRHGEFAWLARLAAPERGRLAIAFFSMLLTGAAGLVVPRFAGRAVDAVLVERSVSGLRTWIGALVGLYVVVAAFDYLEAYLLRSAAARVLRDLRQRLHAHLLSLSPAFYERERVGELVSRLSADIGTIGEALTSRDSSSSGRSG